MEESSEDDGSRQVRNAAFSMRCIFTDSTQLGAIAGPFYVFIGMVVATYIGAAVVDDHWQKQDSRYDRPETFTDSYRR